MLQKWIKKALCSSHVLFLISGFLSVPHSDSLPFVRLFVPSKGVRYLLLHSRFTAFYASLRSFKKRSLASAAHCSHIFGRRSAPAKIVRKLALHNRFTTFWASFYSSKMCSLLSAAHYSRIFVRLFVPSKIVRNLASACYSLSLCVASLLQIGSLLIPA